jgi:hypothetical protein
MTLRTLGTEEYSTALDIPHKNKKTISKTNINKTISLTYQITKCYRTTSIV